MVTARVLLRLENIPNTVFVLYLTVDLIFLELASEFGRTLHHGQLAAFTYTFVFGPFTLIGVTISVVHYSILLTHALS